jgi:RNA polymerase sigma-70 factor (ECF subfamily)
MNDHEQQLYTELLVLRAMQGDRSAFSLIVDLWHPPLLRFAMRYLGNDAESADVVQETWLAAINKLNRIESPSLFVSWLFRVLTNKCIDRLRKKQIHARHMERLAQQEEICTAEEGPGSLTHAIELLPTEHQAIIALRFSQGLQLGQIAAILNLPVGTVKSRLHRAVTQLRHILGDIL